VWEDYLIKVKNCSDLSSILHYDDERAINSKTKVIDERGKVDAQGNCFFQIFVSMQIHKRINAQFSTVRANAFQTKISNNESALLLFLQQSFFNHSCFPNACAYRRTNLTSTVTTISHVKKDEEICICYRPNFSGSSRISLPETHSVRIFDF